MRKILLFVLGLLIITFYSCKKSSVTNAPENNTTIAKTVKIGNQVWSADNLNVDHYRNGDPIPQVQDSNSWIGLNTGAWCYYENKSENGKKYGKLYNWYAVNDPRGLAPEGWHIPTKEEFDTLSSSVNGDANSLKAVGEGTGTNTSGFSALLSGFRYYFGGFSALGYDAFFWSSTEKFETCSYGIYLFLNKSDINVTFFVKAGGLFVRVVKD